jgi:hypothetical protein
LPCQTAALHSCRRQEHEPLAGRSLLVVEAQQTGKVGRIGMLWFGGSPEDLPVRVGFDAFQQGLREQGYVEGRF